MESNKGDIREELQRRMREEKGRFDKLFAEKDLIEEELTAINSRLSALRIVYEDEVRRLGVPARGRRVSRFAGMGVIEALRIIKAEQSNITRQQAHEILVREGFDFRDKKSKRVVNFGWMALKRSEKKRSES